MVERVVLRVRDRVVRWLAKKRLLDARPAEERPNEPAPQTALEACAEAALQHGTFVKLDEDGAVRGSKPFAGPYCPHEGSALPSQWLKLQ